MKTSIHKQSQRLHTYGLLVLLLLPMILLTQQPVQAFLPFETLDGHRQITRDGMLNLTALLSDGNPLGFVDEAINEIVQSNAFVDEDPVTKQKSAFHFDDEKFTESSALLLSLKTQVIDEVLKDSAKTNVEGAKARTKLGQALHILQDYYSHSNWAERGKSGINTLLGGEEPLRSGGSNPPPPDTAVCRTIPFPDNTFDGDQLIEAGTIYSTTGHVNENATNDIDLVCATPDPGKCRHGIPSLCPGLAKDIPFVSPNYTQVAELAVLATRVYVQQIIKDIQNKESSPGGGIDDTQKAKNDNALRALLGHKKSIIFEFSLVRADGALINPALVEEEGGMAVFVSAPNGDFSYAQTELELISDEPAPSDITYSSGTWTLAVPEDGGAFGSPTDITATEFWITIINVADSLDTQYPGIVRESQFEQVVHLIPPGSYSMTLPIFSRGSFNPLVVSGDLRSVSSTRSSVISSVPFEISYSVTFRQRGLSASSQQRVNTETEVVSDNGTVFGPFAFSGSFNDILQAETRIERSPHVNERSYTLTWNIVSGSMEFEPRSASTVHLQAISNSGVSVSLLPSAILD